jgi:hypothetical protein
LLGLGELILRRAPVMQPNLRLSCILEAPVRAVPGLLFFAMRPPHKKPDRTLMTQPGFSQPRGLIPVTIREAFPATGTDSTRDRVGVFLEHKPAKAV